MSDYIYPPDALSANTEIFVCVECSGTVTAVEPPHPVWSNAQNKSVILLDAIVLGGPNGLNS